MFESVGVSGGSSALQNDAHLQNANKEKNPKKQAYAKLECHSLWRLLEGFEYAL